MTSALIDALVAGGPVLTDGAWTTQFHGRGIRPGERCELWNLSQPDVVESIAHSYVEAGSEIILTNTFQANRLSVPDAAEYLAAVNEAGVRISRRAAGEHTKVFASMGPSNKLLITGDVTEAELRDAFTEQAAALGEAEVDAIVIETMSDLTEACIALEAAIATGLPVIASMTFDTGRSKDRTMTGSTATEAAKVLADAGADVVGANCGAGIAAAIPVVAALAEATDLPVWVKANAGVPELVNRQVVYQMTPEEFAGYATGLVDAGASFIGGCCGTTPDFIAALRQAIDHSRPNPL